MEFPYARALVTGGAGFIGSHLIERLLQLGVEVISVDNYVAGKPENLEHLRKHAGLTDAHVDVLDVERLRPLFEGVEVVFHGAASRTTVALNDPRLDLDTNAKGTLNVLELARDFGVRKIVHLSTGSVYGEAVYTPQDEHHPLNPSNYYGVSKLAGEKYASVFGRLYDMDVTVLRNYHVYGPRQDAGPSGGVVAIFCRKALEGQPITVFGDGGQVRSFTYVDDVVRANITVAALAQSRGQIYNCASGIRVTIEDLAREVLALSGNTDQPLRRAGASLGEVRGFAPDNTRIRSLGLEFTAFGEGLSRTFAWYRDHPDA